MENEVDGQGQQVSSEARIGFVCRFIVDPLERLPLASCSLARASPLPRPGQQQRVQVHPVATRVAGIEASCLVLAECVH